jgi:hypothetical protein
MVVLFARIHRATSLQSADAENRVTSTITDQNAVSHMYIEYTTHLADRLEV